MRRTLTEITHSMSSGIKEPNPTVFNLVHREILTDAILTRPALRASVRVALVLRLLVPSDEPPLEAAT